MICLERIRLADGEPIALMHNYLPAALVHLSSEMLGEHGLYELLRASGVRLGSATQRMSAKNAAAAEARALGVTRGAALLTMERVAYDDTRRPVEYGQHLYRASRYALTTTMPAGRPAGREVSTARSRRRRAVITAYHPQGPRIRDELLASRIRTPHWPLRTGRDR